MIPLHLARIRGHGKSTTSVCDTHPSEARGQNGNLAKVTIAAPPTGKRKRNSWVWKVMQQFEPPIRKCSVRCLVEVSKRGRTQPCGALFAWSGSSGTSTLATGIGEVVVPPDLPHLALLARLYHGAEATSCQAERSFSVLSFLIGTLRASMSPFKVEQMMFLKLNQGCLPEGQRYNAVIAAQEERRSQCLNDVQSAQEAAAGETVDVEL